MSAPADVPPPHWSVSVHAGDGRWRGDRWSAPPWLRGARVTHLRVGSARCPELLPTVEELREHTRRARSLDLALELETSVLGDADLRALRSSLEFLAQATPACALVANDWGVVGLARELRWPHAVVAGRLLHRQQRDPRLAALAAGDPEAIPGPWRHGSSHSRAWRRVARDLGVRRVELDWPAHGLADGDRPWASPPALELALHLPEVLVACGRTCVLRDPGGPEDRRLGAGEPCGRRCLEGDDPLVPPWPPPPPGTLAGLRRRGTAEVARLGHDAVREALRWARRARVSRLVMASVHPETRDGHERVS